MTLGGRGHSPHSLQQPEAVQHGHADIRDHDVRRGRPDHAPGLFAVLGFARDGEAAFLQRERADPPAGHRLVVHDEYLHRRFIHPPCPP
ncbi:hypothetical protein OMP40_12095 [Cohnella rhizosphaerae]|uniref:Uncharacterized protein n=1 Tax=Cohnella rhizosphaerae TaxID=1457232 RepID=A0A9X4KXY4_9BACL|nr:hypothetical protein [Cohnella rhizosphaerae]MDG0810007.1 hypothetical protein [Cohnella rhizosphaerae]